MSSDDGTTFVLTGCNSKFQLSSGRNEAGEEVVPEEELLQTREPQVSLPGGEGNDLRESYCLGWDYGTYKGLGIHIRHLP